MVICVIPNNKNNEYEKNNNIYDSNIDRSILTSRIYNKNTN